MMDLLRDGLAVGSAPAEGDARFAKRRYLLHSPTATATTTTTPLPPVDKFLFISETCVPVATLSEFREAFFGPPALYTAALAATATTSPVVTPWHTSWVAARNRNTPGTPTNKYERDQFAEIFRLVPGQYRWKADQWMALARPHAQAICDLDGHFAGWAQQQQQQSREQFWNSFGKISASDEMYFPTALAVLGFLQDPKVAAATLAANGNHRQAGDVKAVTNPGKSGATIASPPGKADASFLEEAGPPAAIEAGKDAVATEKAAATTSTAPAPTAESLSPTIAVTSVTYTDWSEGMRNPKAFFRGPTDLRNIARLARGQGSLVARKFILCPFSDDPASKETTELPGFISTEAWQQVMEETVPLAAIESKIRSTPTIHGFQQRSI
jgi:hypothetical protein